MKNSSTSKSARASNSRRNSLKSLLTLASGAASLGALAPAAEAGIIYTAFNTPVTVGFGSGQLEVFNINLPGTASLQFAARSGRIVARQFSGGAYVAVGQQTNSRSAIKLGSNVAFRTIKGPATWSSPPLVQGANFGNIIQTSAGNIRGPGGFSSTKYLLFSFTDTASTPLPDRPEYGWVSMSSVTAKDGDYTSMSVTFTGWAYDNTGAMIAAGAGIVPVPEVSTGVVSALMAAMFVGGVELRRWRKSKPANASQPA